MRSHKVKLYVLYLHSIGTCAVLTMLYEGVKKALSILTFIFQLMHNTLLGRAHLFVVSLVCSFVFQSLAAFLSRHHLSIGLFCRWLTWSEVVTTSQ